MRNLQGRGRIHNDENQSFSGELIACCCGLRIDCATATRRWF